MNCSTPGFPVHHQLSEFTQTHVHRVSDAIRHLILCRPLLLPSIFPSISVLEEVAANPTIELPELTQTWEIGSWRARQSLVHQDPGERNSDLTEDYVGVQESLAGPWVGGGLLQGWGHGL